MNMSYRKCW